MKSVIARQPGLEVEEQLLVYQQTLKDKVKQLAAMDQVCSGNATISLNNFSTIFFQELEMYIEQVAKFKEEIATIDANMNKLGKKWMKMRRTKGT